MKKELTFNFSSFSLFATIVLFALFASFAACTSSPSIDPSTDSSTDSSTDEKSSPELGVSALFAQYSLDSDLASLSEEKATFLYQVLLNTMEHNSHNLGEVSTNEVWVNEDGREFVYDDEHNLVEDCMNEGTYNYYSFDKEPFLHFAYDTFLWLELGNCADDPSSKEQRVEAFAEDFFDGVNYAFLDWDQVEDFDMSQVTDTVQIYTVNLFAEILNDEALKQYNFDGTDLWMTDKEEFNTFGARLKTSIKETLLY